MISSNDPPLFPAGEFTAPGPYDAEKKSVYVALLRDAPTTIRAAIEGLGDEQLDTKYKNWSIRQIVHHLADSHINAYIRFKWALTEDSPLIKSYDETAWSEVVDAKTLALEPSLTLLDGLHLRWASLVESLGEDSMERSFYHPQSGADVLLSESLPAYVWHTQHHVAQILWLRSQNGWD